MTSEINGIPPIGADRIPILQPAVALSKEVADNQREAVEQLRKEALEAKREADQKAAALQAAQQQTAATDKAGKDDQQPGQQNAASQDAGTGSGGDTKSPAPKGHVSVVA